LYIVKEAIHMRGFARKTVILCLVCLFMSALSGCDGFGKPAQSAQRNETLIALLTPEGAEVVTDVEDFIILESAKPLSDLVHFYRNILYELNVQETGLNDKIEGLWIYSGIYEETKPITIELRDNAERVRIYVIY